MLCPLWLLHSTICHIVCDISPALTSCTRRLWKWVAWVMSPLRSTPPWGASTAVGWCYASLPTNVALGRPAEGVAFRGCRAAGA